MWMYYHKRYREESLIEATGKWQQVTARIAALTRKGVSLTWQVVMISYNLTTMRATKETAITMWSRKRSDDGNGIWVQDPERRKDYTTRMYGTHCIRLQHQARRLTGMIIKDNWKMYLVLRYRMYIYELYMSASHCKCKIKWHKSGVTMLRLMLRKRCSRLYPTSPKIISPKPYSCIWP